VVKYISKNVLHNQNLCIKVVDSSQRSGQPRKWSRGGSVEWTLFDIFRNYYAVNQQKHHENLIHESLKQNILVNTNKIQ